MKNQIVCPHCNKVISNNPIIDEASKGEGADTQSIVCECGERITYWQTTSQLRDQKTVSRRFKNWLHTLGHN
jgi:DNA-directed RNA polymerase subunit RPC12/RpoP